MKNAIPILSTLILLLLPQMLAASRGIPIKGGKQARLALVIGNSNYKSAPLKNPINDANDMAAALNNLGFEVIKKIDADRRAIVRAMNEFGQKLRYADVGIFFFAGHGMQIGGINYLIPVDAQAESASDVEFEAVRAGRLLGKMEDAGSKLNIVILDACRNNPFARSFRSQQMGLAQMAAPKGSIIAYATAPGSVAGDGTGRNGVFTKHLLRQLGRRELPVQDVLRETGLGVMKETSDRQIPWVSSTPVPRYYLAGSGAVVDKAKEPDVVAARSFLAVESSVPGAAVQIDGVQVGQTPLKDLPIAAGEHRVLVMKSGYETYQRRIRVEKGRAKDLYVVLNQERQAPQTGRLFVNVLPAEAEVSFVNVGTRFQQGIELDAGRYQVSVKAKAHEPQLMWINITAGRDRTIEISLAPKHTTPAATGRSWREPTTGMEFVWIPEGCFDMGSPVGEKGRYSEESPVHEVCVDGFWIGKYEVINEQYKRYKSSHNSKNYKGKSLNANDQPAVYVSWEDAKAYAKWLTQKSNSSHTFRLPTEAEWEYAARAGTSTARPWGDDPDEACGYANIADQTTKGKYTLGNIHNCNDGYEVTGPVGRFEANDFGLHDMLGNVWEWCEDIFDRRAYSEHTRNNPIYTGDGTSRVCRGGGWRSRPEEIRSALRDGSSPGSREGDLGFRLLRIE